MDPIEITYSYGGARYGWHASSYHLLHSRNEIVAGGGRTFEAAKAEIESALRWSLEDEALEFTPYIETSAIPQYLAERETAERAAAGKAAAARS